MTDENPLDKKKVRRAAKQKEFRRYLVESGMLECLVKLIVGLEEQQRSPHADAHHLNAEELMTDLFGSYRDPLWDVVEDLYGQIETEKSKYAELQEKIQEAESLVAEETKRTNAVRLWRGFGGTPDAELPGKAGGVLERLCGAGAVKKMPEGVEEPPASIAREVWVDGIANMDSAAYDWATATLLPQLQAEEPEPYAGEKAADEEFLRFMAQVATFKPPAE